MRILITNHALVNRAGSELYVKEVAEGLLRRGHTPIAYSTRLGAVATELREATVPVVDNLAALSVTPDLIHGQHHIETMSALLHFGNVPAVYFCHCWLAWEEAPPRFPRILRLRDDKKAAEEKERQKKLDAERAKRDAVVAKKNAELEKQKQDEQKRREKTLADAADRLKQAQAAYDKSKGQQ